MTPIKIIANVLDDEESVLIGVKHVLSDIPELQIECFTSVQKLFDQLDRSVDLVITDVRLNQGYDIDDIINKILVKNPNCYVIVMSAYMDLVLAEKLSLLGIRWVQKDSAIWLDKLKRIVDLIHPSLKLRAKNKHLFR